MPVDIDGNGVLDCDEFERIWNSSWSEQTEENRDFEDSKEEEAMGFAVKNAVLFPQEAEKGMWPENYSLSDHVRLTVAFTPMKIHCS
ncbi:hypothetical protein SLEP1_g56159 [Rubroshorea leprosula]|uniref:EF-hand domain-containing protein n=1 Tax=Rubroshorea leprosula TaxID=152421 RepID=A0AAV5MIU2_9ROSI|nr:hypothetical protein SLEP1_g56159 [Rubroshorea leprosula]